MKIIEPDLKDQRKYKGWKFINCRYRGYPAETVDQFLDIAEARQMLREYRLAYGDDCSLWISQRPIDDWWEDFWA